MFPAMQGGTRGTEGYTIPGGRFSLGRWREGSGYCIGAVVETGMGVGEESSDRILGGRMRGGRKGEMAGNGMRGVWVIGEGFFRGVGGVFDVSIALLLML